MGLGRVNGEESDEVSNAIGGTVQILTLDAAYINSHMKWIVSRDIQIPIMRSD
jgi:hypothetical protein